MERESKADETVDGGRSSVDGEAACASLAAPLAASPSEFVSEPVIEPLGAETNGTDGSAYMPAPRPSREIEVLPASMDAKAILRRTGVAMAWLLAASVLAGWLFRDWLEFAGAYMIDHYGSRGVFTSVFFIDWIPIPTSAEPIFLLGVTGGMDLFELFVACSSGGVVAALGCYASGVVLERTTPVGRWVQRRHPELVAFVKEHGYKGLAWAAIIPLPFSPMMWIAGIIGMPLERVVVVSLLRIVKTAFYLWLIVVGWGMT